MPEKRTMESAKEDLEEGKTPSTAAGEFVREEMHHVREGKHGARSTKQAIAIGLSKPGVRAFRSNRQARAEHLSALRRPPSAIMRPDRASGSPGRRHANARVPSPRL